MSFFTDLLNVTHPITNLFLHDKDKPDQGPGYEIRDGKVYRTGVPNETGVPVSGIPGTTAKPSDQYYTLADQMRALQDFLPIYSKTVTDQLGATAQAELESSKQTSPQYAQLMADLYRQFGPQLNKIGTDIERQNAMERAASDAAVLRGPGGETVKAAYDTAQIFDRPYYETRDLAAGRLADLLKSVDLGGGLSETERREIEQSLALQGGRRGTYNAPSNTDTVANAMTYGAAGRNRVVQNQDQLTKAIAASAAFLPTAKSGVDVFQVATGRPSVPNTGESKFTGIDKQNTDAINSFANSIMGTGNANASNATSMAINQANINANKKDWLDQFVQFTQGIGNLGSVAGGIACWVAREVYGEQDYRWLLFRDWLYINAPNWFFRLYVRYGEQTAKWLRNKPKLKILIRHWMNSKI